MKTKVLKILGIFFVFIAFICVPIAYGETEAETGEEILIEEVIDVDVDTDKDAEKSRDIKEYKGLCYEKIFGEEETVEQKIAKLPKEVIHIVKEGENLHFLAAVYYKNARLWNKIYKANRDQIKNPNVIHPGQVLNIPIN